MSFLKNIKNFFHKGGKQEMEEEKRQEQQPTQTEPQAQVETKAVETKQPTPQAQVEAKGQEQKQETGTGQTELEKKVATMEQTIPLLTQIVALLMKQGQEQVQPVQQQEQKNPSLQAELTNATEKYKSVGVQGNIGGIQPNKPSFDKKTFLNRK